MIPRSINRWLPSDEKGRAAIFAVAAFVSGAIFPALFGFGINGVLGSLQERAAFPMNVQRIEYDRAQVKTIACGLEALPFQPLMADAISWNLRIVHEHEAQRHWYSRWFSPRSWLKVELIALPCEEKP